MQASHFLPSNLFSSQLRFLLFARCFFWNWWKEFFALTLFHSLMLRQSSSDLSAFLSYLSVCHTHQHARTRAHIILLSIFFVLSTSPSVVVLNAGLWLALIDFVAIARPEDTWWVTFIKVLCAVFLVCVGVRVFNPILCLWAMNAFDVCHVRVCLCVCTCFYACVQYTWHNTRFTHWKILVRVEVKQRRKAKSMMQHTRWAGLGLSSPEDV